MCAQLDLNLIGVGTILNSLTTTCTSFLSLTLMQILHSDLSTASLRLNNVVVCLLHSLLPLINKDVFSVISEVKVIQEEILHTLGLHKSWILSLKWLVF